jgi:hypothetical protein
MSADVVNIRDFKRREEREAADVRLAKQVRAWTPHLARCRLCGRPIRRRSKILHRLGTMTIGG